MRKWMRLKREILIRNTAFFVILCMLIGNAYFPAFAKEGDGNDSSVPKSEDLIPSGLENKDIENENKDLENRDENKDTENKDENKDLENEENKDLENKDENKNTENKVDQPEKPKDNTEKEDPTGNEGESKPDGSEGEKDPDSDVEMNEEPEEEPKEDNGNAEVVEDDIKTEEPEEEKESDEQWEAPEIINMLVPSAYLLAMNPYGLPIRIGEDEITTEQVISGNYGIVNKSSTDQVVKVSLTVEDMNNGEIVFVNSAEEAWNAEEGVYAVYLAAVPANEEEVLVNELPVDENITGEALQNVKMTGAQEHAVALYAGVNEIAFKLSKAIYYIEEIVETSSVDLEGEAEETEQEPEMEKEPELIFGGLASDGQGVTAYTFYGVMNPNAPWEKLSGGIRVSVVYTYQTADGSEEIVEGTGAMISIN